MARPEMDTYRDQWWEQHLRAASTPRKKVHALQSKILADVARLSPEQQDAACELVAQHLKNILDEVQIKVAEGMLA